MYQWWRKNNDTNYQSIFPLYVFFFLNNYLAMYGRWVPVLSGGLHCVQPAPKQRTAPMAILATQPWAPTAHWIVQAPVTLCLQWKIGNGKGRAQMEMKNTLNRKMLLCLIHHADSCLKATTEKTQSMRRALLSLTAFYTRECVDYIILF